MTGYRSALAVVAIVLLAGCSGASAPASPTSSCGEAALVLGGGGHTNQIDQFDHLNVTITTVELKRKSASSDKRVTIDVEDRRVDLAQRRGETMTILENASVPDGTYKKAFLHVANVSGTLTNGTHVNVSVRRDKLKIKKRFNGSGNASLQFTVSPTVVRQDGGYVVKPLLSKSGCSCC